MDELTTIDTTSPEHIQRASLLFAAALLLEVAEPKHDAFPNRTWEDAIAALERWATGAIGGRVALPRTA